MHRIAFAIGAVVMGAALPASAQHMIDVPIWSNGILGQQALRNTYDNYNRVHGIDDEDEAPAASGPRECSPDSLPAADRRRMEQDYMRRLRQDGRASADAWVAEQGRRFRAELIAEGSCPAEPNSR